MTLVLPHPNAFEEDALIEAPPLKETFLAIAGKFSEGIDNSDISPTAGVEGTKLYVGTDNQKKIQTAAIADGAVTGGTGAGAKIAADTITRNNIATDGVGADELRKDAATDANRAVTTDHIRDGAVVKAKIPNSAVVANKIARTGSSVVFEGVTLQARDDPGGGDEATYDLSLAAPAAGVTVVPPAGGSSNFEFLSGRWPTTGSPAGSGHMKITWQLSAEINGTKHWLTIRNISGAIVTVTGTLNLTFITVA